jgi:hypothetical protein
MFRCRRCLAPSLLTAFIPLLYLAGCSDPSGPSIVEHNFGELECSLPEEAMVSGGVPPDGIPSLVDPEFVSAEDPSVDYLEETDRIIGFLTDGEAWAIPHNVGWWHEIVNVEFSSGLQLAVTYCPLTGSSLVFDRSAVDGRDFGVSGILFQNNLVMFDRGDPTSLWFQMGRQARCGPADGVTLPMFPAIETTWAGWKALHPETRVVTGDLDMGRNYRLYPYGNYEQTQELLFRQDDLDDSRFRKERTLGIPEDGGGGIVFPFGLLRMAERGSRAVVHEEARGGDVVVFWDQDVEGAMAFRPEADGVALTFRVVDDRILDQETGSEWRVDGLAVSGPLGGERLQKVAEAYVSFWFAWRAFHPESRVWPGVHEGS